MVPNPNPNPNPNPDPNQVSERRWVPLARLADEVARGGSQFCTEKIRKRVFEEGMHRVCAALPSGTCGAEGAG